MKDTRSSREPLIIHHAGCADGICGALVLWLGLGRRGALLPVQYGDAPPDIKTIEGREVWIVDFSYPRGILEDMNAEASNIMVLDHHKTAAENCEGLDFCTFDSTRSGAKIAYDLMLGLGRLRGEPPDLVDVLGVLVAYVQDRDLWTWELKNSKEISAWLASWPRTLESWYELLCRVTHLGFGRMVGEGQALLRNNDNLISSMAKQAEAVDWIPESCPPLRVLLVNSPVLHSELAAKLLAARECDFVCVWRRTKDKFVYNLRSTTVDVSQIARALGGGGHAKAAGFSSPSRPARFFVTAEKS
ncbi:hypothetical protein LCGC14_0259170 [marine sediment metagenome]|uniref:DHHA1 domain-containing protein n=1 Tax=marine sediment metagenome TaxID=412755 RepID=A0A0F9UJC5_9ZZZZ